MLALDDDTSEFGRRFRSDPLLGRSVRELAGLRPLRLPTVAQAVLRAICGQLIEARRARAIERAVIRTCAEPAPTRQAIGRLSPAELRRLGLATHRASALVRLCRTVDLERLRELPIEAVEARLLRERGFGRWSLGIVALEGLGSYRHGLVGDLSLVKLCSALRGRWVELAETAELLEPYEEWAGLAGVYLLAGWRRGLVPGASADVARARAGGRAPSRLDSVHGRRAEDRDPRRREDRRGARRGPALVRLARARRDLGLDPPRGARRRAARAARDRGHAVERGGRGAGGARRDRGQAAGHRDAARRDRDR